MIVAFTKPKFFYKDMEYMKISITGTLISFYWNFKTHTFLRTQCLIFTDLKDFSFTSNLSFCLEYSLLFEVIKHLTASEVVFKLGDKLIIRDIQSASNLVACDKYFEFEFEFSILKKNLRLVLNSEFGTYEFAISEKDNLLNVCVDDGDLFITYMIFIYVMK